MRENKPAQTEYEFTLIEEYQPTDREGQSDLNRSYEDFLVQEYFFGNRKDLKEWVDYLLAKQAREVWVPGKGWLIDGIDDSQ